MRNLMRSTAFRLSLRYALLYAVLTACVLIAAYLFSRSEFYEWVELDVRGEISELRELERAEGIEAVVREIGHEVSVSRRTSRLYQLTDAEGNHVAGNAHRIAPFEKRLVLPRDSIEIDGSFDEDVTQFVLRSEKIGDGHLVVGKSLHLMLEASEVLAEVMMIGLALLLLTGVALGVVAGRRTERQIDAIRTALSAVAGESLDHRIPVSRQNDDLSRVSEAVNGTLDRLQALVESQQQISTDIAHDLKTPIQRLRQRLERARPEDDRTATVIEESIADVDGIILTFQALLRIAQIEGGARRERFRPVDLTEIGETVASAFAAVAEEEGHSFSFTAPDEPVHVFGDRELLMQLVANLAENAIQHCPAGTRIALELEGDAAQPRLRVRDTGPGIPAEERDRVFRRLYRLEKSRTTSGDGLGLSLAKAVAALHGASITMEDNDPGLTVLVSFPVFAEGV